MQDRNCSCVCSKKLRIPSHFSQGLSGGLEEQVITNPLIDVKQFVQLRWYCKYAVIIATHRQITFKLIYPDELLGVLTLVAVAVSARVVRNALVIALIAIFHMPTHRGGSAITDRSKSLLLIYAHGVLR